MIFHKITFVGVTISLLGSFSSSLPARNEVPNGSRGRQPRRDYHFAYEVRDDKTTNFQNRMELSKDGFLQGSYSHLAPDGVVRTIVYSDDGSSGYQATLHELPTNITVIGSGFPGDPLLQKKSAKHSDDLGVQLVEEERPLSGIPKLPDFMAQLGEFENFGKSVLLESTETDSLELKHALDNDNSKNVLKSELLKDQRSSSSETNVPVVVLDKKFFDAVQSKDVKSLASGIQKALRAAMTENALLQSQSGLRSGVGTKDPDLQNLNEKAAEITKAVNGVGEVPIVALKQNLFNSLDASSKQHIVEAIQQALHAATGTKISQDFNTETGDSLNASFKNKDLIFPKASSEEIEFAVHIDSESLLRKMLGKVNDESISKIKSHPFTTEDNASIIRTETLPNENLAKQTESLFETVNIGQTKGGKKRLKEKVALNSKQSPRAGFAGTGVFPSSNNELRIEHSDSRELDNGIPIILGQSFFDSLITPDNPLNIGDLSGVHKATEADRRLSNLNIEERTEGSDETFQVDIIIGDNPSEVSQGGIPVIAVDQNLFESLDEFGKQQLVIGIQEALKVSMESSISKKDGIRSGKGFRGSGKEGGPNNLSNFDFKSDVAFGISFDPDLEDGTDSNEPTFHGGGIPVIAFEQAAFQSLDNKGKDQLVANIQNALEIALGKSIPKETMKKALEMAIDQSIPSEIVQSPGVKDSRGLELASKIVNEEKTSTSHLSNKQEQTTVNKSKQFIFPPLIFPERKINGIEFPPRIKEKLGKTIGNKMESSKHTEEPKKTKEAFAQSKNSKEGLKKTTPSQVDTRKASSKDEVKTIVDKKGEIGETSMINKGRNKEGIKEATSNKGKHRKSSSVKEETRENLRDNKGNNQKSPIGIGTIINKGRKSKVSREDPRQSSKGKEEIKDGLSDNSQVPIKEAPVKSKGTTKEAPVKSKGAIKEVPSIKSKDDSGGGIPVIALDESVFNSLQKQGGNLSKGQLIAAIQNAMQAALKAEFAEIMAEKTKPVIRKVRQNHEVKSVAIDNPNVKIFSNNLQHFKEIHNKHVKPILDFLLP